MESEVLIPCGEGHTMPERLMHSQLRTGRLVPYLVVCFFAYSSAFAESNQNPTVPSDHASHKEDKITLRGCLGGGPDQFYFATTVADRSFVLTGHTSGLEKYIDREMTLEGSRGDSIPVTGFFEPFPSFEVARIIEVSEKRNPSLSSSFSDTSAWHTERNKMYGVQFAHPDSMSAAPALDPNLQPNFVTAKDTETVSNFAIPGETYSGANLLAGSFTIFVNRHVTNRLSCMQFGQLGPREVPPSPFIVGKLQYTETEGGGAAMGRWDSDYFFHIFQNGLCYELAFGLVEYSAHTADTGCNIPLLSQQDELNLIKPLLERVSFFRPSVAATRENNRHAVPRVSEFTASSQTADNMTNRGLITFFWSTQDAAYV